MWRLTTSELAGRPVYKGQRILFMGTIKATIKSLYVGGRKVSSAYFSTQTIPIFRSESARFVIFVQMSREMWDFDSEGTGEIMFNRVINGFLPELFKRWQRANARHLVSIVMFTRLEYDRRITADVMPFKSETGSLFDPSKSLPQRLKDFYRVVVSDMASGQWTIILNELKKEFRIFLKDVSIQKVEVSTNAPGFSSPQNALDQDQPEPKEVIAGWPTTALRGNILEAINIASSQFSCDYIDRDLVRTGISVVVVTAGTGVFEVDAMALAKTTENLTNNGIGIDLVCLSKMPLHSAPLFKFRKPHNRLDVAPKAITMDSIRNQSPPVAYSPIGSFPSQTLEISPSATTEFGSMTGPPSKILSLESPEQWDYHIPQWIDISFWASEIGSNRHNARNVGQNGSWPSGRQSHQKEFVPRVRMYELQMMGVMENEMSNIFIPYLSEDVPGLAPSSNPLRSKNRFLRISSDLGQPRTSSRSPHHSMITSPLAQSPSFKDSAAKKPLASRQPDQGRGLDWMEGYDDLVFRPFRKPRAAGVRQDGKAKRMSHDQRHKMAAAQSSSDRTSVENNDDTQNHGRAPTPQARKKQNPPPLEQTSNPLSPDAPVARKAKVETGGKPARISRQISFALRGLGPVAPRAVASTEIYAEHVKAAKPLSGASTSNVLAPSVKIAPGGVHVPTSTTASNREKSLHPDANNLALKKQSSAVYISGNSFSRPISIKNSKLDLHEEKPAPIDGNESFSTATTQVPVETKNIDIPQKDTRSKAVDLESKKHGPQAGEESTFRHEKRPWIRTVNPCNPAKNDPKASASFGRWQHVYPHVPRASSVKWKSLCSPAAVPLTTEEFPSEEELLADYAQITHDTSQNEDNEISEDPRARDVLMRDLISIRLSHGYQIVVGPAATEIVGHQVDVFDPKNLAKEGSAVLMSMGNTVQKLVCNTAGQVSITKYTRRPLPELLDPNNEERSFIFLAAIRTILSKEYVPREMKVEDVNEAYDWSLVDSFIGGHYNPDTDYIERLRFWRARFVLLPVDLPSNARRGLHSLAEDTEEEVRLEGIRKITQMWQRYRYVQSDERKFQSSLRKRKDSNPLDILYQTRNPSEVVAAELDKSLLSDGGLERGPTQLLPDSELLQRSNVNLSALAQTIQGEKGITIINRRWHWRLHYNCFIGLELTSWLLQNFRDIDTREEAVEFGNELMKNGLFQHVEKRHNFRDGNYFYQLGADYRVSFPDAKGSWFQSRRSDKSVPSTPLSEALSNDSPLVSRSRSSSNNDDETTDSAVPTPTKMTRSKIAVNLSKSMRYDVDHRKRSNRPEIIELHYDRIHNPDNCYHFRIDWLNVTSKLIEDAIVTWATTADKYGLKLVEVPMAEASTISDKEPFRSPYLVQLGVLPPNDRSSYSLNATSFSPQGGVDRAYYQKAILKKFNFVLDLEAATDFPPDVDVCYSWGKPSYHYPQYIHRSGVLLAQITDDGRFLLTANRLYNTRSATSKEATKLERDDHFYRRPKAYGESLERASPHPSPLVRATSDVLPGGHAHFDMSDICTTPEHIKDDLEAFCQDKEKLAAFYSTTSARPSPAPAQAPLDASIPSLRLPPSVVRRDFSPSPNLDAQAAGSQNLTANGQSPRGSVADSI
jgi:DEP domain-containing protein 5